MLIYGGVSEFLSDIPIDYFSAEGKEALKLIIDLDSKQALSQESFINRLGDEKLKSDYYIELIATQPMINYHHLKDEFIFAYKLENQRQIALKMLQASDEKTILDVSMLLDSRSNDGYRNFSEWISFYESKLESSKYKTGINFLDSALGGGIEGAQLVLISGDPEAGKTSLGVQILENMSQFYKVCLFSFEFTIQQYLKSPKTKGFNPQNMTIINDGYELYQIAQHIRNLYTQGVRVFLIDSQMRIANPKGRNMEEEESLKFSTLARMCHSLDIVVIMIVQTSKSDRDNPMGSKKGGHEASIIIRIEHEKPESNIREFDEFSRIVILKKNKQTGKHYKERVNFDPKSRTFASYVSKEKREKVISYEQIRDDVVDVINI